MNINKSINNILYLKPFAVVTLVISVVVGLFFIWFAFGVYNLEGDKVKNRLEQEGANIDNALIGIIEHTGFIMQNIGKQIKSNYKDKRYIDQILNKYKTNPNISNILSWTIFSWADINHQITVDAVYGILDKPIDLSKRDYISQTINEPGVIKLGKPVKGSTSHRHMIPAGVGIVDNKGEYIGTMTIGFDLEQLVLKLKSLIKNDGLEFALIDLKGKTILKSDKAIIFSYEQKARKSNIQDKFKQILNSKKFNTISEVNFFAKENNFYFHKLENYPYIIYLQYNHKLVRAQLWRDLTSRLLEIIIIGFIAVLLSYFIYRRETRLRIIAEQEHKKAVKASNAKSEFLAYTNHELRGPLNVIIMGSEMIKNKFFGEVPSKYIEYAEDIHQNGKELLEFIEDLLDEMQFASGYFSVNKEANVEVEDIIKKAINLNIGRAHSKKINLNPIIDKDCQNITADPRRLRQIFTNLISNAIKYSPENTIVNIEIKKISGKTNIIITDQGYGMDEHEIEIALSKYGTIKNANNGKIDSVGLGLPLVKQLVEAHGWSLKIESEKGKGTRAIITEG